MSPLDNALRLLAERKAECLRKIADIQKEIDRLKETHRVGEYIADYSEVTSEQLNEPQPELDELFKDSKLISAKRES